MILIGIYDILIDSVTSITSYYARLCDRFIRDPKALKKQHKNVLSLSWLMVLFDLEYQLRILINSVTSIKSYYARLWYIHKRPKSTQETTRERFEFELTYGVEWFRISITFYKCCRKWVPHPTHHSRPSYRKHPVPTSLSGFYSCLHIGSFFDDRLK